MKWTGYRVEDCIIVIIIICSLSLFLKPILPFLPSFLSPLSLHPFCLYLFHRGREAAVTAAAACFMLLSRRRRRRQRGGPTDGMARSTPSSPRSKPQFLPPVFQAGRMRRARARLDKADSFFLPFTDLLFSLRSMVAAMISLPDQIRDAAIPSLSDRA